VSVVSLLNLIDAQLAFGDLPLLDRASFSLLAGERIGLIGRNGTGKSSLLSVIEGRRQLDDGEVRRRDGLRVVLVEQEPELPVVPVSVVDSVSGVDLSSDATEVLPPTVYDSLLIRGSIDEIADERERWRVIARLTEFLHRFDLDGQADPTSASGGERKRAALALAFALEPDLLLLDEPTNHLDIAGIERLEELLVKMPASICITHDRSFLDKVATRIVELDRGTLRSFPGNFATYQRVRADQLSAEKQADRRFDKFWAQEEVWIRKGVEARRTRDEGRVRRLESLRIEREARRERSGSVKISLDAGERSGKLVAELTDVNKSFGDQVIVRDFSMTVQRGDRLGLVGANGVGKSTLLKLMLGELSPDAGNIRLGTNLQVAYFDQMRGQLDPEKTVAETIAPGSDYVEIGNQRKHIMSYLGDFLFPPRRANSPVRTLSGGERNRLLLARLFARPANLIVLDEPTNDLDMESMELLEDTLQSYTGTLLLVSHDRSFLDNVVTQVLAFEGDGHWREYVGGYTDWVRQRPSARVELTGEGVLGGQTMVDTPGGKKTLVSISGQPSSSSLALPAERASKVKLSFKELRELDGLPQKIETLEREQRALADALSQPDYFKRDARLLRADQDRGQKLEDELLKALERWELLEQKRA
jgi:ABC transport system ATP-binding/permease protein